jgi:glycerol-3-phosphate acyltransferase PlsX
VQFGIMGEAYARKILGIASPRIGIVSIGEEDSKGTDLTRETGERLRQTRLNFIGNVEGRDFFSGKADVFVCEGFVGNVVLKTMEGMATALGQFLKTEIKKSAPAMLGALLAGGAIRNVKKRLDYTEYGGAPLLGVRGGVVICHGSSDAKAVKNGIRMAASLSRGGVDVEIAKSLAEHGRLAEEGISVGQ